LYLLLPLTRLVSPAAASPQPSDTRYLMFQNNSKFSLLSFRCCLFNSACFLESECKDTTFFQTTKIFLKKNFIFHSKHVYFNGKKIQFFFHFIKKKVCKKSFSKPIFIIFAGKSATLLLISLYIID